MLRNVRSGSKNFGAIKDALKNDDVCDVVINEVGKGESHVYFKKNA